MISDIFSEEGKYLGKNLLLCMVREIRLEKIKGTYLTILYLVQYLR